MRVDDGLGEEQEPEPRLLVGEPRSPGGLGGQLAGFGPAALLPCGVRQPEQQPRPRDLVPDVRCSVGERRERGDGLVMAIGPCQEHRSGEVGMLHDSPELDGFGTRERAPHGRRGSGPAEEQAGHARRRQRLRSPAGAGRGLRGTDRCDGVTMSGVDVLPTQHVRPRRAFMTLGGDDRGGVAPLENLLEARDRSGQIAFEHQHPAQTDRGFGGQLCRGARGGSFEQPPGLVGLAGGEAEVTGEERPALARHLL